MGSDVKGRRRFPTEVIEALKRAKILGVRVGSEHRYTGVWVVVVQDRVFVRSWNDHPTGWYRAFLAENRGSIHFSDREIEVRASRPRTDRLLEAVSAALGEKYHTKASQKWVRGFAEPERAVNTLEFIPL